MESEFARNLRLDKIRYSRVWEDHRLLEAAFDFADDSAEILSIASAGDNVLNLLLAGQNGPARIVAVDASPAQIALCELKVAGIRHLDHAGFVALLGLSSPAPNADANVDASAKLYAAIRDHLTPASREFWDANGECLAHGATIGGRLETFFARFREAHLFPLVGEANVRAMFDFATLPEQIAHFDAHFRMPEVEAIFRTYFGQENMARDGRDPAQFKYVNAGDVGGHFWGQFCRACTGLLFRENFYMQSFFLGRYLDLDHGPPYLRRANFDWLRQRIDRVEWLTAPLESVLHEPRFARRFTGANLSDIFEYIAEPNAAELLKLLAAAMRPGGRLAYWNLLVPRARPESVAHLLRPVEPLAERLWHEDRAWFYSAFRIEETIG